MDRHVITKIPEVDMQLQKFEGQICNYKNFKARHTIVKISWVDMQLQKILGANMQLLKFQGGYGRQGLGSDGW